MPNRDAGLEEFHRSSSSPQPVPDAVGEDPQDLPVREGLPAHYRMRADAHYVDQLDVSPASSIQMVAVEAIETLDATAPPAAALLDSIRRHGVLEPLLVQKRERRYKLLAGRLRLAAATVLGLREVPCVVRRLTDEEARSLATTAEAQPDGAPSARRLSGLLDGRQMAASLSAVLSCADLLTEGIPLLTRQVAVDMIRAETQRAICTLRTIEFLKRGVAEGSSAVAARRILDGVVDAVGPEVRLRGSRLVTRVEVNDETMIDVDDQALVSAVSAVVLLLSMGLKDVRGARLDLHVTNHPVGRITFAVAQESVILPNATLAIANGEDPAIDSSVAPLVALRQLAECYGGTCAVSRLARGTQVSLTLPQSD